jgi:hypothetical protein
VSIVQKWLDNPVRERDLGKWNWKSCYYSLHDSYCNVITSLSLSPSSNPCPPTTFHIKDCYTIARRDYTLTTRKPRNSFSLTKTFVSHSKYFYYRIALTRTLHQLKQGWTNSGSQVARTNKFAIGT